MRRIYNKTVERLFERHRSVQTAGFSSDAYKPGLEQMFDYARFLGNPQQEWRGVHVAGTNGKGSVCSMLSAALSAAGFKTGLYTSPHLVDFRERMKLLVPPDRVLMPEAEMISEAAVCDFLEHYDREGLSFFEVTTGMAFKWFADSKVDVAVIETGLGGRLDSTNIITPLISIITSIGLDHCALLGGTRAEIAAEKAGIFKPGVPALVWGRDPETQPVFEKAAAEVGCPLFFAEDYSVPEDFPPLDLTGPCQEENLRTVIAALTILQRDPQFVVAQRVEQKYLPETGEEEIDKSLTNSDLCFTDVLSPIVQQAIAAAGRITGLRGRWEIVLRDPLTICDIAHNPPALAVNFARLSTHRPLLVVFGAMADKDEESIAGILPQDAEYFLVQPHTPRAMSTSDLALKLKRNCFSVQPSVAAGVQAALERAKLLPDPIIYIGGSTYVVSEAISYLESI